MKTIRYIEGVASVSLDREVCVGCSMCVNVCPHEVFVLKENKAIMIDKDGCMECGACAKNCPVSAISVSQGVGCASLIFNRMFKGKNISVDGCC